MAYVLQLSALCFDFLVVFYGSVLVAFAVCYSFNLKILDVDAECCAYCK